jgi:hypothetical protein
VLLLLGSEEVKKKQKKTKNAFTHVCGAQHHSIPTKKENLKEKTPPNL